MQRTGESQGPDISPPAQQRLLPAGEPPHLRPHQTGEGGDDEEHEGREDDGGHVCEDDQGEGRDRLPVSLLRAGARKPSSPH